MKALTIWQPWASLIARGVKQYETRSWPTKYRGPIAIHAAVKDPNKLPGAVKEELERAVRELFNAEKCQSSPWRWLPTGAVIATAELVEVWHIIGIHRIPGKINGVQTGADAEGGPYLLAVLESMSRRGKSKGIMYFSHLGVSEKEIALGDWTPGRYAWELANVKPLPRPIPVKGKQGLWNFEIPKEDTQK